MNERNKRYIPALRFHWLTPLYDPALRWLMTTVFGPLAALKAVKPAGVGK